MTQPALNLFKKQTYAIQYWVLQEISNDRLGEQHVYCICDKCYVAVAYCSDKKIAVQLLLNKVGRIVLEVLIPGYNPDMRVAHKNNFLVKRFVSRE